VNEESDSTPKADGDRQTGPRLLGYARPPKNGRGKPILPPNQSYAGMFAVVPALALAWLTLLLVAASYQGAGEAAGGICCLFVPCTLAAAIAGLLGLTEETPQGQKRDGTLAKWALLTTALCWAALGVLLVLNGLLRR
jgi:hypothetical protein